MEVRHRQVDVRDLRLHLAEAGDGPLVVFCHGFPGLWRSWIHQLPAVAAHGWRGVALDMPGYGESSRPADVDRYAAERVVADLLALLDALGEERAVFVGHDFGANLVWELALREPERVEGVVALSVPFTGRSRRRPTEAFAALAGRHFLHLHYFQEPGVADAELAASPAEFLRRVMWALSGAGDYFAVFAHPSAGNGYLDVLPPAPPLPWPWLTQAELDGFVAAYERTGFSGGLAWYRVLDRNWERSAHLDGAAVTVPAVYVAGAGDPVLSGFAGADPLADMRRLVPGLRETVVIPGAGHFVQLERPGALNDVLVRTLDAWRPGAKGGR